MVRSRSSPAADGGAFAASIGAVKKAVARSPACSASGLAGGEREAAREGATVLGRPSLWSAFAHHSRADSSAPCEQRVSGSAGVTAAQRAVSVQGRLHCRRGQVKGPRTF